MAVAGQLITSKIASTSRTMLRQWGDITHQAAVTLPDHHPASLLSFGLPEAQFPLRKIAAKEFELAARSQQEMFAWVNDGLCLDRARVGATMIQQQTTGAPVAASNDVITAAVLEGKSEGIFKGGWGFHAATIAHPEGSVEPMVIDYLLFAEPVPISRWAAAIDSERGAMMVHGPFFNNSGTLAKHPTKGITPKFVGPNGLEATWDQLRPGSRVPDVWRLPVSGSDSVIPKLLRHGSFKDVLRAGTGDEASAAQVGTAA